MPETSGRVQSDQTESHGNALSIPSISLPKGGGAIRGIGEKFAANPVSGTGSMTVPIATSPGRSGFGPQLSLSYDSGSGNGPFGFGWSLSIPCITRKTDKGLPSYDDANESDVFILSGAEDLVPVVPQPSIPSVSGYTIKHYRPRIEGLFARIERWTSQTDSTDVCWRSISKDNITTWYGKIPDSRIYDPNCHEHIFYWLISSSYDDKGNAIAYKYVHEDAAGIIQGQANEANRTDTSCSANRYLKCILYGNRKPNRDLSTWEAFDPEQLSGVSDWMFEVLFDYGEGHYCQLSGAGQDPRHVTAQTTIPDGPSWPVRKDPFSSYRAGFEVRTYRLCRRVLMFHHFLTELEVSDYLVRSTEFTYDETLVASYITSVSQSGYVLQPDDNHPRQSDPGKLNRYYQKSLPPLEFTYSRVPDARQLSKLPVQVIDPASLENLPYGLDGKVYQWVDLDGEGISGILSEQAGAWFYKPNLGAGKFGPIQTVSSLPSLADLNAGRQQLLDLAGDGQLDLVDFHAPTPGFFERTEDQDWEAFQSFRSLPNLDWGDPNLRFVDLNGDGHADVLITEEDVFTWYPSLAKDGFAEAETVRQPLDDEKGPRLVFADGEQSISLADLSGDGLSDLVRIRNGEVCYWPNLGYGRFGAKVTMDNAPWFDAPDQFDQRHIRLADIDGSGTTDIVYLGANGVQIYFNQCGNAWSDPASLPQIPPVNDLASVQVMDLLGTGTACLVWSSPLPGDLSWPMGYIDLMDGQKPHLLVKVANNLGAETRVTYVSSTKFYLEDKANGTPWITRLPFPVQVVERVETYDWISRNRFVTCYSYHHGFYDGIEREFHGFGRVDQKDTEEISTISPGTQTSEDTNWDAASFVPPILTMTWFHTGAYFAGGKISKHFEDEYYHEGDPSLGLPGLTDDQLEPIELPDTVLPATIRLANGTRTPVVLTADEEREACRVLKGSILRQEIYALDSSEKADRPYSASERNYTIELLQPQNDNRHAVFFAHSRESIDFHYERMLYDTASGQQADPRVSHAMTLEVDSCGNVLKSTAIGYGRRYDDPDPMLNGTDRDEQKRIYVTYTENETTNAILEDDDYRIPLPAEIRIYEILQMKPDSSRPDASQPLVTHLFLFDEMAAKLQNASDGKHEILYEDVLHAGVSDDQPWRRLIERVRTLYRKNDLTDLSSFKDLESMALPGDSFKLAFTPGLLSAIFKRKRTDGSWEDLLPDPTSILGQATGKGAGYVHLDGDNNWWVPVGRIFYSPNSNDNASAEVAHARQHFFLPVRYRDPFYTDQFITETTLSFDPYDLLIQETQDALGSRVTAGERDKKGALAASGIDYRVLQPKLITDPNGNRSAAAFDALGLLAGMAVMGKNPALGFKKEGDLLDDSFVADLTPQQISDFLNKPLDYAGDRLGNATTRIIYDLDCFKASGMPAFAATLMRETHVSALGPTGITRIQLNFSYSDGFGREIQKKIQAEPGLVEVEDDAGNVTTVDTTPAIRWVGSGWTIFNNKGKPFRQYEPFFSIDPRFQFGKKVGVSSVLFYDPVERVVATLHPNHTFEKVAFDPWRQASWDVNDTAGLDPRTDPDVSAYMAKYFASQPASWKTWLQERIKDPQNPPADTQGKTPAQDVAVRTLAHASTPTVAFFDSLGRTFLTVADNGPDQNTTPQKYHTRVILDIENNQRQVWDARDRLVMSYDYDMLSNRAHQASMEACERWMLNDVTGKPLYAWDSRGHTFHSEYDPLRRLVRSFVTGTDPGDPAHEILFECSVYGEQHPDDLNLNLRGKIFLHLDQAGVVTNENYDFKGNLLRGTRRLAQGYQKAADWKDVDVKIPEDSHLKVDLATLEAGLGPSVESETFTSSTRYDALNRPVQVAAPYSDQPSPLRINVIQPAYNEAGLLERVEVWLGQTAEPANLLDPASTTPSQVGIDNIDYNAKGQRVHILYSNQTCTDYTYDPQTFRLTNLKTTRPVGLDGLASQLFKDPATVVQDLSYSYDPAGNITHLSDRALPSLIYNGQPVDPQADYFYDAIYRLISAAGREHIGQTGFDFAPLDDSYRDYPFAGLKANPNDPKALRNYTEDYDYDEVGNFTKMKHSASGGGWTRRYYYDAASLLRPGSENGNRLTSTQVGNGISNPDDTYGYTDKDGQDVHGCMTAINTMSMVWDFKDQLQQVALGGGGTAFYTYDASGQRMRKVIHNQNGKKQKERIYLGAFEVYREYNAASGALKLERETLHLMDDKQRMALVETNTITNEVLIRYQLANHLGSGMLELNENVEVISYEEYSPYGASSFQAVRGDMEVPAKRYRYTGKERDEESGLYYHGARYYAPWLGRWVSCDPSFLKAGPDLFQYSLNNPIRLRDSNGAWPSAGDLADKWAKADILGWTPGSLIPGITGEKITQFVEHQVDKAINASIDAQPHGEGILASAQRFTAQVNATIVKTGATLLTGIIAGNLDPGYVVRGVMHLGEGAAAGVENLEKGKTAVGLSQIVGDVSQAVLIAAPAVKGALSLVKKAPSIPSNAPASPPEPIKGSSPLKNITADEIEGATQAEPKSGNLERTPVKSDKQINIEKQAEYEAQKKAWEESGRENREIAQQNWLFEKYGIWEIEEHSIGGDLTPMAGVWEDAIQPPKPGYNLVPSGDKTLLVRKNN